MSEGGGAFVVRRILVAVDASRPSIGVLETAARLAAEFQAELNGIFVEDINLLRLAGLPFARELAWTSATELHLDYQRMERALRGHAAHARQTVINVSTQLNLQATLHTVRGHVVQELLQAADGVDLLILGKGGSLASNRIGSVARRMAREAPCSVLLPAKAGGLRHGPVMVTFSGDDREGRSLSAAARFARAGRDKLLVLMPVSTEAAYDSLQNQARRLLGAGSLLVTYQAVKTLEIGLYQRLVREEGVGLMVHTGSGAEAAGLENKLAALDCSVLLVR